MSDRDCEALCRDLLAIVDRLSDAVSRIEEDLCDRHDETSIERWPDEDRYFLDDLEMG